MEQIKIELYHEYSKIDECHYFGIVTENISNTEFIKNYIQWIWYYIGYNSAKIKSKKIKLLPYKSGKLLKKYKFCNDAEYQSIKIINRINKKTHGTTTPTQTINA